jgi:hypothetical protein
VTTLTDAITTPSTPRSMTSSMKVRSRSTWPSVLQMYVPYSPLCTASASPRVSTL